MTRRPARGGALDRGAAAVEFALLLPLLLLLVFGIIDFGRALNAQVTLTQAAREGARLDRAEPAERGEPYPGRGDRAEPGHGDRRSACPSGAGPDVHRGRQGHLLVQVRHPGRSDRRDVRRARDPGRRSRSPPRESCHANTTPDDAPRPGGAAAPARQGRPRRPWRDGRDAASPAACWWAWAPSSSTSASSTPSGPSCRTAPTRARSRWPRPARSARARRASPPSTPTPTPATGHPPSTWCAAPAWATARASTGKIIDCPSSPTAGTNFVDVHTSTLTAGGSTLLPPVFARDAAGQRQLHRHHGACLRAGRVGRLLGRGHGLVHAARPATGPRRPTSGTSFAPPPPSAQLRRRCSTGAEAGRLAGHRLPRRPGQLDGTGLFGWTTTESATARWWCRTTAATPAATGLSRLPARRPWPAPRRTGPSCSSPCTRPAPISGSGTMHLLAEGLRRLRGHRVLPARLPTPRTG